MNGRRLFLKLAGLCFALAGPFGAQAADVYPAKTVKIVVPFAAGGGSDILTRTVAAKLQEKWAQPVIVENMPGAGTTIATASVAKAAPDGYTLLIAASSMGPNVSLYKNLTFNAEKDLAPISGLVTFPNVMLIHPDLPVKNLADLIALAKSKPGQLNYASVGNGTTPHLSMEVLKKMAGIDMVHVPYKGTAPAVTAVMAGEAAVMFGDPAGASTFIKSGRLKALAVSVPGGSPLMPGVPAISDTVPGFSVEAWFALAAPAGTPQDVIKKINASAAEVLAMPDVKEKLISLGLQPEPTTPEALGARISKEIKEWAAHIKEINVSID